MRADKSRRLATKGIGHIVHLFHWFGPTQDTTSIEITVRTTQEAKELAETAAGRRLLRLGTEMPLTDHPRGIASGGEALRKQSLRQRQAVSAVGIIFMAKTGLLTSGE